MKPSVLIVDDEPLTRNLLRLMLERDGYLIFEAGDGLQALAAVTQNMPDLLILDVMMPNMDGIAVCESLRAEVKTAGLPIILLSARTSPDAIRAGMAAGANLYLGKPVGREELVRTVREVLASVPQTAE